MSRKDVIKALKVSEREAPYVWDGQDEDERPATTEELAHGMALARKRGRPAGSGVKEQVAIRDVELAYRNELDMQQEQEITRLKRERDEFASQGGEQILERLSKLGVVFVVYHPGAGHLTIPLQDVARYQDNPMAYAAAKCFVSEAQYRQWLNHYQSPTCEAQLPSGERCGIPIDRIDTHSLQIRGANALSLAGPAH